MSNACTDHRNQVMEGLVYLNGDYLPARDARISVFDRGFLFGDGVYEVAPVVLGRLVDRQYLLERLERSLGELAMVWPCPKAEYLAVLQELVARNRLQEGIVYSQITRGVAARQFEFPANAVPGFMAFTAPVNLLHNPAAASGIKVTTTADLRWKRRDIKSINLLGQCLAKQDAVSQGAQEGWMMEDGYITEGVSSSAYIVRDGTVITRPLSHAILPGIRRRTLLELAALESITVDERLFTLEEALAADEAFISSATTMALPVVEIDGHPVGSGVPGPVSLKLRELYTHRVLAEARATKPPMSEATRN